MIVFDNGHACARRCKEVKANHKECVEAQKTEYASGVLAAFRLCRLCSYRKGGECLKVGR